MAAAMGMGADWDRVLSYIPPSRLATAEQQQRLLSMQMSMMMGVKTMQSRQRTNTAPRPPRQPAGQQWKGRPVREEREEREEEDEQEVDDSELLDEDGDDEEIRAMKSELRQLRAERAAPTSTATKTAATAPTLTQPPPQPRPQPQPAPSAMLTQPTASDLAALVERMTVNSSLDDPD